MLTGGFQGKHLAVLLVQGIVVDVVGGAEHDSTKKGKKGGVLEMRVDDSADDGAVDQLDAEGDLSLEAVTMNSFLKRSHWNCFL